jgi:hypothetical protein
MTEAEVVGYAQLWPKGEEEAPWEARVVIQLPIRWYSELMSAISASRRRGHATMAQNSALQHDACLPGVRMYAEFIQEKVIEIVNVPSADQRHVGKSVQKR